MHWVKKAKYIEEYKIILTFNDRSQKIVDFKTILRGFEGEVFQPLKDIEYFKRFKVALDTVTWPNGADICPDVLYEKGTEVENTPMKQTSQRPTSASTRIRKKAAAKSVTRKRCK